ncbi:hypothetical protein B566_EDAN008416 [Ephemera danica]|nr:hypothetical protein B566_EDAN008416 [Ephemera danica]
MSVSNEAVSDISLQEHHPRWLFLYTSCSKCATGEYLPSQNKYTDLKYMMDIKRVVKHSQRYIILEKLFYAHKVE